MKYVDVIAAILLIVGGLNWGLVGLFKFDLVAALTGNNFGEVNALSMIVYALVGLAAAYQAASLWTVPRRWGSDDRLTNVRA